MRIHAMRHGHTNYNEAGLCNDDPEKPVHLTARGRQQALRAAGTLKAQPLDRIIVSQLPRTRETAEIVNQHHRVPVVTHPALNDIVTGFDGCPVTEYFQATGADRLHLRAPGGESLLDYKYRVLKVFDWLADQHWQNVLIIAHEETLRVFTVHLHDLPDTAMESLHFDNCQIVEFDFPPGQQT